MEIHQLRYFEEICKTLNYRQAAENLHVSQPALSKAILKLEAELEGTLFERLGRSIQLSAYGKTFLPYVEQALTALRNGEEKLKNWNDPYQGTIRIAFIQSIGTTLLPKVLPEFSTNYPNVHIDLMQCNSKEALALVEADLVDVCFIMSDFKKRDAVNQINIREERLYGYCSLEHELAMTESVSLSALQSFDFIGFNDQQILQQQMRMWCEKVGFHPRMVFQGTDVPTIAGLISANLGIGIIPYYVGMEALQLHRFNIEDCDNIRLIQLAWKKSQHTKPSVELFIEFTQNLFK
ncbi:LysR family transcriptional regulator [Kurthia senegalensis]|uniref:LysR family transcriptional regulator n=1 Tax=Kurthia senegalensis TaxID=1033740 RepID=UPI0002898D14|nr:LysR family transcriptional regulator [Kurthia senegalensis]